MKSATQLLRQYRPESYTVPSGSAICLACGKSRQKPRPDTGFGAYLADAIVVLILACMAAVTANPCIGDIPAATDRVSPRRASANPAVLTSPEAAKAGNPKTRWTKRGNGKPVADELTVFDATELKSNRRTQMRDAASTDQVRYPEHEETDMSMDATDNIGKTTTAREKESNMPSESKIEDKHLAIRSGEEGQSSDRMPPAVLNHKSLVGDRLLPGGQSVVRLLQQNESLLVQLCGVGEAMFQSVAEISRVGRRPREMWLGDGRMWILDEADFVMQEFSCADWTYRATHSLGHLLLSSERRDEVSFLAGTRRVLLETRDLSGLKRRLEFRTRIIDMDEERVVAECGDAGLCQLIAGSRPAKIFRYGRRYDEGIYGADGSFVAALHLPKDIELSSLAVGPKGEGFQCVSPGYDSSGRVIMELLLFDARGKVKARMPLPEKEIVMETAALPAQLRTLVQTYNVETGVICWWSYVYGDRGYRLEGRCIVPRNVSLMQDQDATSAVFCVREKGGGMQFRRVDPVHGLLGLFSDEEWS
jgi:hypothetical protein